MNSNHMEPALVLGRLRSSAHTLITSLKGYERVAVIAAGALLPVYLIDGQFFRLLDEIAFSFRSGSFPSGRFYILCASTALMVYAVVLLCRSRRSAPQEASLPARHPCLVVKQVPAYLYKAEVKSDLLDATELVGMHTHIDLASRAHLEQIPSAMDVLGDNDALLDIYASLHPDAAPSPSDPGGMKTLFEILGEHERPEIKSEADLHALIDNA